jgi:hypothetical protein
MKKGQKEIILRVPRRQLQTESVYDKIQKHVQENSDYAFTRVGLMVEVFGFKKEDLNTSFKNWPEGASAMYSRIKRALGKLKDEGLIESAKKGRQYLYRWRLEE